MQAAKMGEIERFRIVDALFIIGSIVTFIADQATGQTAGMHTRTHTAMATNCWKFNWKLPVTCLPMDILI